MSKKGEYKQGGDDEATRELKNYMKAVGVIDITRFKNEVNQRRMKAKIPKDMLSKLIHSPSKGSSLGRNSIIDERVIDEREEINNEIREQQSILSRNNLV